MEGDRGERWKAGKFDYGYEGEMCMEKSLKMRVCRNKAAFTLVEVLIALALGMLVFLPALAAFNSALKAGGRHAEISLLHVAAATALETRVAVLRRGEAVAARDVCQGAERVVMRVRREEEPPAQTVEAVAEQTEDLRCTFTRTLFPPIRRIAESTPEPENSIP